MARKLVRQHSKLNETAGEKTPWLNPLLNPNRTRKTNRDIPRTVDSVILISERIL